jgi:hypothetical protein
MLLQTQLRLRLLNAEVLQQSLPVSGCVLLVTDLTNLVLISHSCWGVFLAFSLLLELLKSISVPGLIIIVNEVVDVGKLRLFGSDDELTVLVLGEVDFIRMGALLVKLAISRFLVRITQVLAATSPASTTTVLLLGAAGTLKLLSALGNP